ncbi:hypothetical protein [Thiobacter aerophilum]|uniref:Uncharacterized protein n=1 Tax=Thiobacter aerophilum TaxID=3121275 RepID=A0ABV0EK00_9BURK
MAEQERTPHGLPGHTATPVDPSRRRFTGAGLAGSGIILTLVSHPVLGHSGGNQCTRSAILSGNLSNQQGDTQCGCSPGYWGQHPEIWGKLTDDLYLPSMVFNTVFGRNVFNNNATLGEVAQQSHNLDLVSIPNTCNMQGYYAKVRNASFHAVAALLNAATFAWRYLPLYDTPQKVINAYQAAFDAATRDCGAALDQLKSEWDQYSRLYCGYDAHGNHR